MSNTATNLKGPNSFFKLGKGSKQAQENAGDDLVLDYSLKDESMQLQIQINQTLLSRISIMSRQGKHDKP